MRASVEEIPLEMQVDGIETRGVDVGDHLVRHIDLPAGRRLHPAVRGPARRPVPVPALGLRRRGLDHLRYADGTEEINRAGEVYYWPGGHTGWTDEGVVFVEFSPADEIRPVLEHLAAQLRAVGLTYRSCSVERGTSSSDDRAWPRRCVPTGRARTTRPARDRTTIRVPPPSGSSCWPTRRGGSAGSTSASSTVRRRTARTTTSVTTAAPASARSGCTSTTASRPSPAIAGGWLQRARRSLEDDTECVEYGALRAARGGGRARRGASSRSRRRWPPRWSSSAAGCGRPISRPRPCRRSGGCSSTAATRCAAWPISTRRCCSRSRAGCGRTPRARCTAASSARARSSATARAPRSGREATARWAERPPVRGVPRRLPRPPRRRTQLAGRAGRGRARSRAGVHGADHDPPAQRRRRVRRDRLTSAAGSATSTAPRRRSRGPRSCAADRPGSALLRLAQGRIDAALDIIGGCLDDAGLEPARSGQAPPRPRADRDRRR